MIYNFIGLFIILGCWFGNYPMPEFQTIYTLWQVVTWVFIVLHIVMFLPNSKQMAIKAMQEEKNPPVSRSTKLFMLCAITSFILAGQTWVALGFFFVVLPAMYLLYNWQKEFEKKSKRRYNK